MAGDDNDNNQPWENRGAHRTGGCVGFQQVPVGARQNLQQNHWCIVINCDFQNHHPGVSRLLFGAVCPALCYTFTHSFWAYMYCKDNFNRAQRALGIPRISKSQWVNFSTHTLVLQDVFSHWLGTASAQSDPSGLQRCQSEKGWIIIYIIIKMAPIL